MRGAGEEDLPDPLRLALDQTIGHGDRVRIGIEDLVGGGDRPAAMPFLIRAYGLRGRAPQDQAGAASLSGLIAALTEFAGQDANLAAALARQDETAGLDEEALAWIELALARRRAELTAAPDGGADGSDDKGSLRSLASDDAALLARLLVRLGRPARGRAALEEALTFPPDPFQAHHDLGQLLRASDPVAARPHLSRALELLGGQGFPAELEASIRAGLQ